MVRELFSSDVVKTKTFKILWDLDLVDKPSLLVQFNGPTLLGRYVGSLPAVDQQDGRVESVKMKTKINIVSDHINVK